MPLTFGVLAAVAASSPSSNDVTPGVLGFLVVAAMGVALVFLLRSMNKQFRKIAPEGPRRPSPGICNGVQARPERDGRAGSAQVGRARRFARNCPSPLLAWAQARSGALHAGNPRGLGARRAVPVGRGPGPAAGAGAELAGRRRPAFTCRGRIRSPARPPSWPTCSRSRPGSRRRRGPQGGPRRADPAAAHGRRRPAGLAGTRPPGGAGQHPELRARQLRRRPGAAGCRWRAGGYPCSPSARPPRSRCSLIPGWAVPGRRTRRAIAGGSLTYLAAVARFAASLAARGRVLPVLEAEGDGVRRPVAAGARRRRRAARPRPGRGHAPVLPGGLRAGPRNAARQRPGCPGRRRRPGPAARPAAARPARPHPGAPPAGRTVRAGPDHDRCPPRRGDAAGRGGERPRWPRNSTRGGTAP